jgi:trk system potassium uptake protein
VHVVVVGCGRVGSGLAVALVDAGHTVVVVDRRAAAFERLPPGFGGKLVTGIGFDRAVLRSAGIEEAGALAAVTNGDNSNIVTARVAREHFGVEQVVARIYDPRRAAIYERLGIPTVATVAWTVDRVLRRILPAEPGVQWTDPSGQLSLVERPVPPAWAGRTLHDLETALGARVTVVTRLGKAQIPPADLVVQDGDLVHLVAGADDVRRVDALLASGPKGTSH